MQVIMFVSDISTKYELTVPLRSYREKLDFKFVILIKPK